MREIKFRAWDKTTKRMFVPVRHLYVNGKFTATDPKTGFCSELVMQYTGLHDKDGKEIYEGDILGWMCGGVGQGDGTPAKSEVYFDRYKFAVRTGRTSFGWKLSQAAEVIGNVHENPELLEDK